MVQSAFHRVGVLVSGILSGIVATAVPLAAQDFEGMSKEQRKQLMSAYIELDTIDQVLAVCSELAPDYAAANATIIAECKRAHRIGAARPFVDEFISWLKATEPAVETTLPAAIGLTRKAVHAAIAGSSEDCEENFRGKLFDQEFKNVAAIVASHGLESADTQTAVTARPASAAPVVETPSAETWKRSSPIVTGLKSMWPAPGSFCIRRIG